MRIIFSTNEFSLQTTIISGIITINGGARDITINMY